MLTNEFCRILYDYESIFYRNYEQELPDRIY